MPLVENQRKTLGDGRNIKLLRSVKLAAFSPQTNNYPFSSTCSSLRFSNISYSAPTIIKRALKIDQDENCM
jgi:hypothetical protein